MTGNSAAESGAEAGDGTSLGGVVRIDDGRLQAHLDEGVRSTVEEALNALLNAEADHLCGARKYERSADPKTRRIPAAAPSYKGGIRRSKGGDDQGL